MKQSLSIIVFLLLSSLIAGCSDDKDGNPFVESLGTIKPAKNIEGSLIKDEESGRWMFKPKHNFDFIGGDCYIVGDPIYGLKVYIDNWNPDYEQYKDDCVVNGYFQEIGYIKDGNGSTIGNTIVIKLTIESIDYIVPDPVYDPEFVAGTIMINTVGKAPIVSKEKYVDCSISVEHANKDWNFEDVSAGIRGRGNSTWEWYPKKPYRIKFEKKQSMLGLEAAKSWVLLAEYRDPTALMNAFVFELGQLAGIPFTNHNRYVRVVLNGDYIGLYHLTEQVQQGKSRVNIDEDNGYLIQLDADDGPELSPDATDNFWSSTYYMPVCVKNPDEPTADVIRKVKQDLAQLEEAIRTRNWEDVDSHLDVGTMIDFLIIQEFVYNVELDAPRSMYMHKDVGGKWVMGPLWDFDAGFDFDWNTMTTGHNYFASYKELVLGTDPRTHAGTIYEVPGFFSDLFYMPKFVEAYKKRWKEVSDMIPLAWDKAYTYYLANSEDYSINADIWKIDKDYATEIEHMNSWIKNRQSYLNTIIAQY